MVISCEPLKECIMFELSKEGVEFVKKELGRYETPYSAIIPCLFECKKKMEAG